MDTSADSAARRQANVTTFHEVLRLMGSSQFAAACQLLTDDVRCEWPYAPIPGLTEKVGREAVLSMFSARMGRMEDFNFTILETYELLDPEALVVEYTSHTRRRDSGVEYGNRYIAVVRFRDGLIALWREYLNTMLVAQLNPGEWDLPAHWRVPAPGG